MGKTKLIDDDKEKAQLEAKIALADFLKNSHSRREIQAELLEKSLKWYKLSPFESRRVVLATMRGLARAEINFFGKPNLDPAHLIRAAYREILKSDEGRHHRLVELTKQRFRTEIRRSEEVIFEFQTAAQPRLQRLGFEPHEVDVLTMQTIEAAWLGTIIWSDQYRSAQSYLFGILRSHVGNRWKQSRRLSRVLEVQLKSRLEDIPDGHHAVDPAVATDKIRFVKRAAEEMKKRKNGFMLMVGFWLWMDGYTLEQSAERLGISVPEVKNLRKQMMSVLRELGASPDMDPYRR